MITSTGCRSAATRSVGTFIDGQLILTVAHGVAGQTAISVTTLAGQTFSARIVAIDVEQDLALLKIDEALDENQFPKLSFGDAQPGEDAYFVAFDETQQFVRKAKIKRRLKINTQDIYLKNKVTRLGIEAEVQVQVGNSGGPLINSSGQIIGIVWSTSRITNNRTWATRVKMATRLINDVSAYPNPPSAKPVACTA